MEYWECLAICWVRGPGLEEAYRHWTVTARTPTSADAWCCHVLPARSANDCMQEAITLLPEHHRMYDFREAIPEAVLNSRWTANGDKR